MGQFILIDPSVKGTGGHYYEYALRVLQAASKRGYTPLLAAHREAEDMGSPGFTILRQFRFSFFDNIEWLNAAERRARDKLEAAKAAAKTKAYREALRFAQREVSRAGLDRARAAELSSPADPAFGLMSSPWAEYRSNPRRLLLSMAMRRAGARLSRMQRHAAPVQRFGAQIKRTFGKVLRIAKVGVRVGMSVVLAPLASVRERLLPNSRQRVFERDLQAALTAARVRAGDVVFVPTLGELELAGIVALCQRNPVARTLRWRLLFRRNIFSSSMADRTREANQPELRRMRSLLSYARSALLGVDVSFYADTKPLSSQYASLGIFPFRTAPIPVDDRFADLQKVRDTNDTLVFAYLGDARTEKGFPALPGAIDRIAHDLVVPRRAKIVVQSNFNTEHGEPDCIKAHLGLMTWPQDQVERVYGPLETDAYVGLMRQADAILLPYSQQNYSARSSGVFAEALRAGLPSIVTGGSWMAGMLEPYRQAHLDSTFGKLATSRRELLRAERIEGDRMLGELIQIPVGRANTVAAEIECPANPDFFFKLDYVLLSGSGETIGTVSERIRLIRGRLRALTLIPDGVRWIKVYASVPGSAASIVPDVISLSLVTQTKPTAIGMGGVICDGSDISLALAMRNIATNFQTYATDARKLAVDLGANFTPESLVDMLAGRDNDNDSGHRGILQTPAAAQPATGMRPLLRTTLQAEGAA